MTPLETRGDSCYSRPPRTTARHSASFTHPLGKEDMHVPVCWRQRQRRRRVKTAPGVRLSVAFVN